MKCPTCGHDIPVELRVDLDTNTVHRKEKAIRITPIEAELIHVLVNAHKPLGIYDLEDLVYGSHTRKDQSGATRVHISMARRALKELDYGIACIPHRGYVLREGNNSKPANAEWPEEEVKFLKENYHRGRRVIKQHLPHRSYGAIYQKAIKYGLLATGNRTPAASRKIVKRRTENRTS